MIYPPRGKPRSKAIAEVLAMIADAHPDLVLHHPRPVRDTDEWLLESATEFAPRWTVTLDALHNRKNRIRRAYSQQALASLFLRAIL
jgi:hypothetical protein